MAHKGVTVVTLPGRKTKGTPAGFSLLTFLPGDLNRTLARPARLPKPDDFNIE
jgi:hypothetical protein